jgi:hypothetical protein
MLHGSKLRAHEPRGQIRLPMHPIATVGMIRR